MAVGSASELEYFLLLARDLGYLAPQVYAALSSEARKTKRMLTGLIATLTDSGQWTADGASYNKEGG